MNTDSLKFDATLPKRDFASALTEATAKGFKIKTERMSAPDAAMPARPRLNELDSATIDRVLEMAWEDRTTFDVIEQQFGLKEKDVIAVMRKHMKRSSFKMWRKRVTARKTKHAKKSSFDVGRFKSTNQKNY